MDAIQVELDELARGTRGDAGYDDNQDDMWLAPESIQFCKQVLNEMVIRGISLPFALAPYSAGDNKAIAMEWKVNDSFVILTINLPNGGMKIHTQDVMLRKEYMVIPSTDKERIQDILDFLIGSKLI